jgi:hypothetical protein
MKILKVSQFDREKRERDAWLATTQNKDSKTDNFAVVLDKNNKSIPSSVKSKINNSLYKLGNYHKHIPMDQVFDILEQNGVIVLQEDGTKWEGFATTQGECGSDEAKQAPMKFDLAVNTSNGYMHADNYLIMSVCTMPSGNLEVVCYVS